MSFMTSLEQGLHRAGININDIHVEPAQGQFEINYEPTWGILGADWPFIIRGALKDCAAKAGLAMLGDHDSNDARDLLAWRVGWAPRSLPVSNA